VLWANRVCRRAHAAVVASAGRSYEPWNQNFCLWALDQHSARHIFRGACTVVRDVFTRVSKNRRHFFTRPNCFELFGLDMMVAEDGPSRRAV
jgi:hypothetical protein